jgi:hypothetical protein
MQADCGRAGDAGREDTEESHSEHERELRCRRRGVPGAVSGSRLAGQQRPLVTERVTVAVWGSCRKFADAGEQCATSIGTRTQTHSQRSFAGRRTSSARIGTSFAKSGPSAIIRRAAAGGSGPASLRREASGSRTSGRRSRRRAQLGVSRGQTPSTLPPTPDMLARTAGPQPAADPKRAGHQHARPDSGASRTPRFREEGLASAKPPWRILSCSDTGPARCRRRS